ncbi:cellulase family glycosylhydrolase [Tichowtungia aerotolerans]|uniref:Cellulase family glycosylhydrolase n=1 Tax=Tichowtungia aerotolerans TaxID=2697043 RepID=A0A6P1M8I9_9BACT|nr:cellulase family glycosylhydrolase [Tichowtungia aerotolerans]QHI68844.1 cellulase family glycosylhydrolase [Tichowtungia aerotolerans]
MKRWFFVLMLTVCAGCASTPPGLTVKDGEFLKDGKPFHGIGVNYFTAFIRKLGLEGGTPNLNDDSYRQGFATLREHDIAFVRFAVGGFFPNEWKSYQENRTAYFEAFDRLVADAEAAGIGLIPSLFWFFPTVPDLVGEPIDQWGNLDSQTIAFMRQYTTEVVSRYKDSPAIWAWEFGNEFIHEADLPPPELGRGWIVPDFGTPSERTARDKMFRKNIYVAYQAFADTVHAIDLHRPVLSGDTMPRPTAYHNFHDGAWGIDTKAEWEEIFLQDNAAMDALSAHFYYFSLDEENHDGGFMEYGPEQQLPFMMEISRRADKPLWIGEFGPSGKKKTPDQERRQFEFILNLFVENKVPLSALWNFDFEHVDQTPWNIMEDNHRAWMLDALQEANQRLQKEKD